MRLDKFLKAARLIKRRSLAQEMIANDAVRVNDRPCKASYNVKPGDVVSVAFPRHLLRVRILIVDEVLLKRGGQCYEVLGERAIDPDEVPW
ncbi:MAG TPA: RNA-binding S4 domain-containing protein [Thermosynergistes sp.]|nr:RNA-binding S4 domain-containing protein [Thermosynergistes sp.]